MMQVVLIDTFVVPEASRAALVEAARESATFLRTLPGFVEGYIFEKTDGDSPHTIVTTAVWQDQASFENAKKSAAAEFQRVGFNPQEIMSNLNVTMQRAVYRRLAY
jgi:heme-degrading monooxygenase HmoA